MEIKITVIDKAQLIEGLKSAFYGNKRQAREYFNGYGRYKFRKNLKEGFSRIESIENVLFEVVEGDQEKCKEALNAALSASIPDTHAWCSWDHLVIFLAIVVAYILWFMWTKWDFIWIRNIVLVLLALVLLAAIVLAKLAYHFKN